MMFSLQIRFLAQALLFAIGLIFSASLYAQSYQADLESATKKLHFYVVNSLRPFLDNKGSASVLQLNQSTDFKLSEDPVPNAWVRQDDRSNRSTIFMTGEFRLLLTYLADVHMIASTNRRFFPCWNSYVDALFDHQAQNRQRIGNNLRPYEIPAPEIYLKSAGANCKEYVSAFPIDPKLRPTRDFLVDMVIGLTYLHELGHLAKGHQPIDLSSLPSGPANDRSLKIFLNLMERSQKQEIEADTWAADRFVDFLDDPMVIVNTFLWSFYLTQSGLDCSLAATDSHPNGLDRFTRMAKRIRDRSLDQKKITPNYPLNKLVDDTITFSQKVKETLKCP